MGIKERIKRTFWGRYLVSELHCIESWLIPRIIDDETAVRRFYRKTMGKELNLDNPQTYSEKMNWYKLNCRKPLMQQCSDKFDARAYIKSKGYGENLNQVYGVYDKVSDLDIDALPENFVLKATHGSRMQVIVKGNKKEINWRQQKMMMRSWLHQNIYWSGREWVYKDLPKRIIAEEFLEDETGELKDYKFFCFNGKVGYFELDGGRFLGCHYRNYYDPDLNPLPFADVGTPNNWDVPFPITKEVYLKMREMAENLAEPFQYVRVDFYVVNGKIYCGELTFFDSGGTVDYTMPEYDEILGKLWKLEKN